MARFFAFVPAAGSGSRLGGERPKQYLDVAGRPLLFHAAARLAGHQAIEQVFVVLAPGDSWFARFDWRALAGRLTPLYCGGETRAASVLNGLLAAGDRVQATDWALVHDAARPCLGLAELHRLITDLEGETAGGLLAIPVTDTIKREDGAARVVRTEARERLWQAQTPQMFRYGLLIEALRGPGAVDATDEAQAIENLGLKPRLVPGSARNIKVTYPGDVALAELILAASEPPLNAAGRRHE